MSIQWRSENRKIADLKLAEYNPRQATEKEVHDLTVSIERFSLADPIIINKNNQVIGGHFRIRILKDKGILEADVRVPDVQLTDEQERELNLRLNKNVGEWDFDNLANFDEELLLDVGFSAAELDNIFQLEEGKTEPDAIPAVPDHPKAKLGDVFLLGDHRLMCGNSTKASDVVILMNGQQADMVFTDPPYNVDYKGAGKDTSAKTNLANIQSHGKLNQSRSEHSRLIRRSRQYPDSMRTPKEKMFYYGI